MILFFVLVPVLSALAALFIRSNKLRRALLVTTGAIHLGLVITSFFVETAELFDGWLVFDAPGRLFLSITSFLFFMASMYAVNYLARDSRHHHGSATSEFTLRFFEFSREAVFTTCMLLFLSTMSLVTISHHLGLLWVAMEATTLASAPLIYFHRNNFSLEATWKYLLICSVGIGLALFGNMLLLVACPADGSGPMHLMLNSFIDDASLLQPQWLKMAFIFFIVGYGTKMGLAPLHTWLPDAHSEAPSFVSALLSGALLNCAFLGILRIHQICIAAGLAYFSQELFRIFGMGSLFFAAVFIIKQKDYKRMLAYSSVEHMGIIALGVGLGGEAVFGSMLHAVNHSLTKGMLFMVAGNILAFYGTRSTDDVVGVYKRLWFSGLLWTMGFFAITGTPPFGLFISEFIILKNAFISGYFITAAFYLILLSVIFIAMGVIFLNMVQGSPHEPKDAKPHVLFRERFFSVFPPAVLCALTLVLGVYIPDFLRDALATAAKSFGG